MKRLILLVFFLTYACSTPRPEGRTEAEVLFKEAKTLIEDERYLMANEKLNQIRSQHPYSYFATDAELLQADILFLQENFVEAAAAYIVFRDFHPKYKDLNYVVWKIAESFYYQLPSTFDRDLTPAHEAVKYYDELVRVFPDSKYVNDAKDKIKYSREMIQNKEVYIADFYYRTKEFAAAKYRYLDILDKFQDEGMQALSMHRVLESTLKLKDKKDCLTYYYKFSGITNSDETKKKLDSVHEECMKLEDNV